MATATQQDVMKRCYEFRQGSSDKFWTIEVIGSTVFVTYGKIGSCGATQVKSFPSAYRATEFAYKMIREKTGKGYVPAPESRYPGAPPEQIAATRGPAPAAAPVPEPPRPTSAAPVDGERHIDL